MLVSKKRNLKIKKLLHLGNNKPYVKINLPLVFKTSILDHSLYKQKKVKSRNAGIQKLIDYIAVLPAGEGNVFLKLCKPKRSEWGTTQKAEMINLLTATN